MKKIIEFFFLCFMLSDGIRLSYHTAYLNIESAAEHIAPRLFVYRSAPPTLTRTGFCGMIYKEIFAAGNAAITRKSDFSNGKERAAL